MNLTQIPVDMAGLRGNFKMVDYIILVFVLLSSLIVGMVAGRRKTASTRDFLTGGRQMNPIAVCLSLLGGVVSTLSVQGNSAEMYLYGTQLWMNLIGCIWGTLIVMFLLLPVLYPLNLVSMCQYLEMRFKSPLLKKLGSAVQITNSSMYLGICLYAPSLTLSAAVGIPMPVSIITFGTICAIYISLGGVRAVIYTDVIQTLMMFLGVLAVVVQVVLSMGGFQNVWDIADKGQRLEFFNMDPSPFVRHSFWSVQVLGVYFVTSVLGISQAQFQRLVSVKSLRISQGLCVAFFIGLVMLWSVMNFSGIAAYAAYADCDPLASGKIEQVDQILPYMVGDKLSHVTGMFGLFVAAVAGALLSSLSSQANSMVVLLWEDFLKGSWMFEKFSQEAATRVTKIMSAGMVLLGVSFAFLVSKLGTLFQAGYSITGALIGPFDGLFIIAITAPWVNAKGAICGFVSALTFNLWLVIGKFIYGAGRSEPLPTSTLGCEADSVLVRSHDNLTNFEYYVTTPSSVQDISEVTDSNDHLRFYDISYCYLGAMGIIIVFVVSTIASLITGVVKPSEVDLRLVNLRCYRVYCWLYGHKADSAELLSFQVRQKEAAEQPLDWDCQVADDIVKSQEVKAIERDIGDV